MRRLSQAALISLLILFLFFGELFLTSFVVPSLPAAGMLATPTLDMLNQTADAFTGDPMDLTDSAPTPQPVSVSASGCVPGEVIVTSPEPGQEISGTITLVGTANIDNFGFYKYEVSPQGADAWATISAGRETVRNSDLGLWDTSSLTPGDYELRLEVTDNQGLALPPCVIPVRVLAP